MSLLYCSIILQFKRPLEEHILSLGKGWPCNMQHLHQQQGFAFEETVKGTPNENTSRPK